MERYKNECQMLAYLAKRQLNLPKNAIKGDFEDLELDEIIDLLKEEIYEMIVEVDYNYYEPKVINFEIDIDKALAEIGDVASCLVGLIAKINQIQKNKFIDNFKIDVETAIDELNRS